MASKYLSEWREFDKNEAFWNEVFVGRMITGASCNGMSRRATFADSTEIVAQFSITLDTKEVAYLPGEPDWGGLDLIAPAPAGPVMQRIQRLIWDDVGIAEIVLQWGSIKLDKTYAGRGRLWIRDDFDREASVSGPTPGVDPIAEAVDKQIVEKMVGFVVHEDVEYTGEAAAALRRAGVESDPGLEKKYATPEIEHDTSGRAGELDAPQPTDRKCRTCDAVMTVQTWSSSDGGHEDDKYTCPNGHVEWVDGIDS